MGLGTYACLAEVINQSFICEQAEKEYREFFATLKDYGCSLNEFANAFQDEDFGELFDITQEGEVINKWLKLKEAFDKRTGLDLSIGYHVAEDRGDEVDGAFFQVDGVYQYTPAGEKYKDKIIRKTWTVWN